VIPADHKWFARLLVADVINETLDGMDLKVPILSRLEKRSLATIRRQLVGRRAARRSPLGSTK
jgi:hypothetical protein